MLPWQSNPPNPVPLYQHDFKRPIGTWLFMGFCIWCDCNSDMLAPKRLGRSNIAQVPLLRRYRWNQQKLWSWNDCSGWIMLFSKGLCSVTCVVALIPLFHSALQCTATCGGGMQVRSVQCLANGRAATECLLHQKPIASQACNTNFCPLPEKKGILTPCFSCKTFTLRFRLWRCSWC